MTWISAALRQYEFIKPHIRPEEGLFADHSKGQAFIYHGDVSYHPPSAIMRKLTSRPVGAPLTEELERGLFPWRFEERDDGRA